MKVFGKDLLADAIHGDLNSLSSRVKTFIHLITQVLLLRMKFFKEKLIYFERAPDTCNDHHFVIFHCFTWCLASVSSILQENSSFLYGRSMKIVRNNLLKLLLRRCWFNKLRCFKRIRVTRNLDWKLLKCFLLKKIGIVYIYFVINMSIVKKGTCCLSNTILTCFPHTLCIIDVKC